MICKNCGNQMEDNAAFCTNCGTAVAEAAPEAPVVEQSTPVTATVVEQPAAAPAAPKSKNHSGNPCLVLRRFRRS
ncbi:MAG: zinc ribbon domain-containing protein [Clostridia bacterium]|nr:zinc ribbon domain-containing protein [Clostridia bacterium]